MVETRVVAVIVGLADVRALRGDQAASHAPRQQTEAERGEQHGEGGHPQRLIRRRHGAEVLACTRIEPAADLVGGDPLLRPIADVGAPGGSVRARATRERLAGSERAHDLPRQIVGSPLVRFAFCTRVDAHESDRGDDDQRPRVTHVRNMCTPSPQSHVA